MTDCPPIRVLHAIHDFLPRHVAGSEIYVAELSAALARRGHHPVVLCAEFDPSRRHAQLTWRVVGALPVVELVNMGGVCKSSVQEYYQSKTAMPATTAEAGCPDTQTANAKSPVITNGLIEIQADSGLRTQLIAAGSGTALVFTPFCGEPATPACVGAPVTAWDCKLNTTIKPKYLPGECR